MRKDFLTVDQLKQLWQNELLPSIRKGVNADLAKYQWLDADAQGTLPGNWKLAEFHDINKIWYFDECPWIMHQSRKQQYVVKYSHMFRISWYTGLKISWRIRVIYYEILHTTLLSYTVVLKSSLNYSTIILRLLGRVVQSWVKITQG